MRVGSIVKLRVSILDNDVGALGLCYEEYKIGEHSGYSIIFENGRYDGFSLECKEVEKFLEEISFSKNHSRYEFKNVLQLSYDFDNGLFDDIFKNIKI